MNAVLEFGVDLKESRPLNCDRVFSFEKGPVSCLMLGNGLQLPPCTDTNLFI